MSAAPPTPWTLRCAWCEWHIVVHPRGARGKDPGSGVEAAHAMAAHVEHEHRKSWSEYLEATKGASDE